MGGGKTLAVTGAQSGSWMPWERAFRIAAAWMKDACSGGGGQAPLHQLAFDPVIYIPTELLYAQGCLMIRKRESLANAVSV